MNSQSRRVISTAILVMLPILAVKLSLSKAGPAASVPSYRVKGDLKAKATLVEFSDFQCPACAKAQPSVKNLYKVYEGRLKIVFKHYPLAMHPHALPAARAAECAGRQNQFWPYHDLLFEKQAEWAQAEDPPSFFQSFAEEVGLNTEEFSSCLSDESVLALITADKNEGAKIGIRGTPTFFIGERRMTGSSFSNLAPKAVEWELKR